MKDTWMHHKVPDEAQCLRLWLCSAVTLNKCISCSNGCFCLVSSADWGCGGFQLVHSGSARGSPSHSSDLVFATRTGTGRGIESHIFRVETHWDLSTWTRALVQGVHAAAEIIKEVSIVSRLMVEAKPVLALQGKFKAGVVFVDCLKNVPSNSHSTSRNHLRCKVGVKGRSVSLQVERI
ncbi:hypothetical protein XENOCAPTIV_008883 [Xenoophorus captivus]|uniref:PH domain-containing protein n=1 Tax=Xenoophorus captivus TaxID=1517983 RepID=A0ABV0RGD1_9TELE